MRACGALLRGPARVVLFLGLLVGLGLAVLGWRLQQGPIPLPFAERALERFAAEHDVPLRLGGASLAWAGWRDGHVLPVVLRLDDVALDSPAVAEETAPASPPLRIAWAEVTLAPAGLLRGEVRPGTLVLHEPAVTLELGPDGRPTMLPPLASGEGGADPLAGLLKPPDPDEPLGALRELRVTNARVRVRQASRGLEGGVENASLLLRRDRSGTLTAEGDGSARLGEASTPWTARARAVPGAGEGAPELEAGLSLGEVEPSRFAAHLPEAAVLTGLSGTVALDLRVRSANGKTEGSATLRAGPGEVALPEGGKVAFSAASATVSGTPEAVRLESAVLTLARPKRASGRAPGAGPTLTASGTAARGTAGWRAVLDAALDRVDVSELSHYWPSSLAPGGRGWITENLSAGVARGGRWHAELSAGPSGETPKLEALTGTLEVEDGVLHWLRPVPPLEAVSGTMRFVSPAEIVVEAKARQRGTALVVSQATVRITGLGTTEHLTIEGRAAGPAADVVELIRHPRLHLFDQRPLDLKEPAGRLEATLNMNFPLLADLPAELIRLRVAARVTDAHLSALVAGQPLDHGNLDIAVDNQGLRAAGTADLGPVRGAKLAVELDFRPGSPGQVVARHRVEGSVEARGTGGLRARPRRGGERAAHRHRRGRATPRRRHPCGSARRPARRAPGTGALDWAKPAGTAATGEATLVVRDEVSPHRREPAPGLRRSAGARAACCSGPLRASSSWRSPKRASATAA